MTKYVAPSLTAKQTAAVSVAKLLARMGVPIFCAHADASSSTGYRLPKNWQTTTANERYADAWAPGMALCAVMGHTLDLVDVDPHNGGDAGALAGMLPDTYGIASTPSGGLHLFVASLGIRSRDGVRVGVDVKSGDASGRGRGFAFIAPTERVSKASGSLGVYTWVVEPTEIQLAFAGSDSTGGALRSSIAALRSTNGKPGPAPVATDPAPAGASIVGAPLASPPASEPVTVSYATATWNGVLSDCRAAPLGTHNVTLNRAAFQLGRMVPAFWSAEDVTGALLAVAASIEDVSRPWGDAAAVTIASGLSAGMAVPVGRADEPEDGFGFLSPSTRPPFAEPIGPTSTGSVTTVLSFGAEYDPDAFFDKHGLLALKLATSVLDTTPCALTAEGNVAVYLSGVYRVSREAFSAEVVRRLRNRFRPGHLAAAESVAAGLLHEMNARLPDHSPKALLNCANGMLDLASGSLLPHSPAYLSSCQIPVSFDPAARCPTYLTWASMVELIDPDAPDPFSVLLDLEETCSAMLDPSRTPPKAAFLYGPSRSGKSTYLRLMAAIAGRENIASVTLHTLAESHFAAASLYGKMLNSAADLSDRHVRDLSLFKMLTGEDSIHADRKFGRIFSYTNRALFMFSANTVPTVSEATRAYAERIKPFRFYSSFAGRETPAIEDAMMTELPGILARLVRGWQERARRGWYRATASATMHDFEVSSNRVAQWFAEECALAVIDADPSVAEPKVPAGQGVTASAITAAFKAWAQENNMEPMGRNKLVERLTSTVAGIRMVRIGDGAVRGYNVILPKRTLV